MAGGFKFNGMLAYRALAVVSLLAAIIEPRWSLHSFCWIIIGVALWIAAERFKDVAKIKAKAQAETTTALQKQYADQAKADIDSYYGRMSTIIANAYETAQKQLAVYIRDSSPTRQR